MIIIYKVCFPNNKFYIGLSANKIKERKKQHINCAKNNSKYPFHKALLKHGIENTIWEIIDSTDSINEAHILEKKYIYLFNSFIKLNGYNCTLGGEGHLLYSDEYLFEISKKYQHKSEWKKDSPQTYTSTRKRGLLDQCCSHMTKKNNFYKKEDIIKVASECLLLKDFIKKYPNHYRKSLKLKIIDLIYPNRQKKRSFNELKRIAKKYNNMTEFQKNDQAAYSSARKYGILPKITKHMIRPSLDSYKKEDGVCIYKTTKPILYKNKIYLGIRDLERKEKIPKTTSQSWLQSDKLMIEKEIRYATEQEVLNFGLNPQDFDLYKKT